MSTYWIQRIVDWDPMESDAEIRAGIPVDLVAHLQGLLGLTDAEVARIIGRSRSTYVRYRTLQKHLGLTEAERAVRFTQLLALASGTHGSLAEATEWMLAPNEGLGGARPFDLAETDPGAMLVRDLLSGVQHGFVM